MTYRRFEDVPVWQDAARLARQVFDLVDDRSFRMRGDLANDAIRVRMPHAKHGEAERHCAPHVVSCQLWLVVSC